MDECPVCLESLKTTTGEVITVGCCNKQFHTHCYIKAMEVNKSCPLCRKPHAVVIEIPPQQVVVVVPEVKFFIYRTFATSVFVVCFLYLINLR